MYQLPSLHSLTTVIWILSMKSLSSMRRRNPSNTRPEIRTNRGTQIKAMHLLHLKQIERRGTLNPRRHTLHSLTIDGKFACIENWAIYLCLFRVRDEYNKSRYDPLTEITTSLARSSSRPSSSRTERRSYPMGPPVTSDSALSERLKRESGERARAVELRERRRREKAGSETPSTVAGGYTNQYNKQDVEEARRRREEAQGWRQRVSAWHKRDPKDWDKEDRDYRRDRDRSWDRQH